MHRAVEPEEMVGMVLFLYSDAASYVTGQAFVVDGGQMIRGLVPVETELLSTHGLHARSAAASA